LYRKGRSGQAEAVLSIIMFSRVERLFKGGGSVSSTTDIGQTLTLDDYTVTVLSLIAEGTIANRTTTLTAMV
jgi:hypothetical protein